MNIIKNLSMRHPNQRKHNKNTDSQRQKEMWDICINSGKQTKVKVTFRTKNTIQNKVKPHPQIERYAKCGDAK
jgi:major membrane immunogen (membrane-anchored lipoprotein)